MVSRPTISEAVDRSARHPTQLVEELPLLELMGAELPVVRAALRTAIALVAIILVGFGVRDWFMVPTVAPYTTAVRLATVPVALFAYRRASGTPQQAYLSALVFIYAVVAAYGVVLMLLPRGIELHAVSLLIIPLGATMFLPRVKDLVWLQLWLGIWFQIGVGLARMPVHELVAIESGLAVSMVVTHVLGSIAIRGRHQRLRLERQLREAADRDALTGAHNRRHIAASGQHEVLRSRRYGRALSVVAIDIDHFKRVNDGFGHAVGDEVIRATVRLLQQRTRECDIVGRMGGEEFILILPETDCASAQGLAERLRIAITQAQVVTSVGPVRWTVSCGVAGLTDADASLDDLVRRADRALYTAKAAGRNRVVARSAGSFLASADGGVPIEPLDLPRSARVLGSTGLAHDDDADLAGVG